MAKSTRTTTTRQGRRRRSTKVDQYGRDKTYSRYIHKLLQCICPDLTIGNVAMNVMNSFVKDILQRISSEASELVKHTKQTTMKSNDIITATRLVIKTPDLCRNAIEMAHLVVNYTERNRQ